MKRLSILFATLALISLCLETPEPLFASHCRAVAMTSCDDGTWLTCEGHTACDFGWKWVWCDGQSWVCPECSWGGGPCL